MASLSDYTKAVLFMQIGQGEQFVVNGILYFRHGVMNTPDGNFNCQIVRNGQESSLRFDQFYRWFDDSEQVMAHKNA